MYRKLRELCGPIPDDLRPGSPLDNVAVRVCNPEHREKYIQTVAPPTERYGIPIDRTMLSHENSFVPNFHSYGPGEQYIINKILMSPLKMIYIIGGIGVGKTHFLKFFRNEVLPSIRHASTLNSTKCPSTVYIDFNSEKQTFTNASAEEIAQRLNDRLYTSMMSMIGKKFFSLDAEINVVWDELIEQQPEDDSETPVNYALEYLRVRLRDLAAEPKDLDRDQHQVMKVRRQIRNEIILRNDLKIDYVAGLTRYILATYYAGHEYCFSLIVDNVDILPARVQHELRGVLQNFSLNSNIRTIITARQTTYYQRFDHAVSLLVDKVPFCGRSPWNIVDRRLMSFLKNPSLYAEGLPSGDLQALTTGLRVVRAHFRRKPTKNLFQDLCGNSVRKGLILGQFLINNISYNPVNIGKSSDARKMPVNSITRALLCGTRPIYRWDSENESVVVQNLFQVEAWPNNTYFTKLRILRAVNSTTAKGLPLGRLLEILEGFGYSTGVTVAALDELMLNQKRLLWSDSTLEFGDEETLLEHMHTLLNLSSAGRAYSVSVFKRIEYIQEVMLDTSIDTAGLGPQWNYTTLEDRFSLVLEFLKFMFVQDANEVTGFCSRLGREEYRKAFGKSAMLSHEMIEQVLQDVRVILRDRNQDFLVAHEKAYEELLARIRYAEDVLLNGAPDTRGQIAAFLRK